MTEQRHIDAINAFTRFMLKWFQNEEYNDLTHGDKEATRNDAIQSLHHIHQRFGDISVALICNCWLQCDVFDAETDQYEICDNAVKAMSEIFELEKQAANLRDNIEHSKQQVRHHERAIEFNEVMLKSVEDKLDAIGKQWSEQ